MCTTARGKFRSGVAELFGLARFPRSCGPRLLNGAIFRRRSGDGLGVRFPALDGGARAQLALEERALASMLEERQLVRRTVGTHAFELGGRHGADTARAIPSRSSDFPSVFRQRCAAAHDRAAQMCAAP